MELPELLDELVVRLFAFHTCEKSFVTGPMTPCLEHVPPSLLAIPSSLITHVAEGVIWVAVRLVCVLDQLVQVGDEPVSRLEGWGIQGLANIQPVLWMVAICLIFSRTDFASSMSIVERKLRISMAKMASRLGEDIILSCILSIMPQMELDT